MNPLKIASILGFKGFLVSKPSCVHIMAGGKYYFFQPTYFKVNKKVAVNTDIVSCVENFMKHNPGRYFIIYYFKDVSEEILKSIGYIQVLPWHFLCDVARGKFILVGSRKDYKYFEKYCKYRASHDYNRCKGSSTCKENKGRPSQRRSTDKSGAAGSRRLFYSRKRRQTRLYY